MKILNLSVYRFQALSDLDAIRADLASFCDEFKLKGTILLATEGVNAFVAGEAAAVEAFEAKLGETLGAPDLKGKRSWSDSVPFKRMFVKIKKDIIPYGEEIRVDGTRGQAIEPQELKRWYDEKRDFVILDTRNQFEFDIGTFENAISLNLTNFREFAGKVEALPENFREKPVVVFCTGGVRCEKVSLDMERKGFKNVLQLEGGILKYFEDCGDSHYTGNCFVFDDRRAVNAKLEPAPV